MPYGRRYRKRRRTFRRRRRPVYSQRAFGNRRRTFSKPRRVSAYSKINRNRRMLSFATPREPSDPPSGRRSWRQAFNDAYDGARYYSSSVGHYGASGVKLLKAAAPYAPAASALVGAFRGYQRRQPRPLPWHPYTVEEIV